MRSLSVNDCKRLACLALLAFIPCAPLRAGNQPWMARGKSGMVATDSEYASAAGLAILRQGGNAFDATVAASFTLAVTRPYSTGLGGGGFLIARMSGGATFVQDFRETAPVAATPGMFAMPRAEGAPPPSRYGGLAVAVPGLLAARMQLLEERGTMSLAQVIQPAIRLARDGYHVDAHYVESIKEVAEKFQRHPQFVDSFRYVVHRHLRDGKLCNVGDRLVQPELAGLLERLAGGESFYRGPIAQAIVRAVRDAGGILTEQDLRQYRVAQRAPLRWTYRGFDFIGMPPPSSGGVTVAQTLNILEHFKMGAEFEKDPIQATHLTIEAMKHAFADRARWLGDPDFVSVPVARLISKEYASGIAGRIDRSGTREPADYGSATLTDDAGTSHFCIVDRWGNAVVTTETINTLFGSLLAVDELGLILNNEMDDFSTEPGKANAFGLVQSPRNAVAPRKRPLSSMSPTIVLKDDRPVLMLGASGGPRIISSVVNVAINVLDRQMPLDEAVAALRPHHQWLPRKLFFDADVPDQVAASLSARGHQVSDKHKRGMLQAIVRDGEEWVGASDPRKGGRPAGY